MGCTTLRKIIELDNRIFSSERHTLKAMCGVSLCQLLAGVQHNTLLLHPCCASLKPQLQDLAARWASLPCVFDRVRRSTTIPPKTLESILTLLFSLLPSPGIPRTARVAQTVRHMGAPATTSDEPNIASMTGTTGFGAAVVLGGGYAIANEVSISQNLSIRARRLIYRLPSFFTC